MILNMSYGASKAQIVDFTLSEDTNIHIEDVVINNVRLSSGTYEGFSISPITQITPDELSVIHIFNRLGSTIGLNGVYKSGNNYNLLEDSNSYDFRYNATTQTITFRLSLSGSNMKAGTYRLVIW